MSSPSLARALRWLFAVATLLSSALLVLAATLQSFGSVRRQILLSLVGLAVGAFVAQILVEARRKRAGLVALGLSQLSYHLLIWAGWSTESLLWRVFWVTSVAALGAAYLVSFDATARDWLERGTRRSAIGLALLLAGLGLFPTFPHLPGPLYQVILAIFGAGTLTGSLVLWLRRRQERPAPPSLTAASKLAWLALSHTAFLFGGWFLGRVALPPSTRFEELPAVLANLSRDELDAQLATDLERLKIVVAGVDELSRSYRELDAELRRKLEADHRDYYLPEEEDRIRALFMSYLSYRSALLRMVATYVGFDVVRDDEARARCFTLGYAAAMTTFRASLELVHSYRDEIARLKLNEPEREWGIPAGMFDRIYEAVTNEHNMELATEMAAYFELERTGWREAGVWAPGDFDWLEGRILEGFSYVRDRSLAGKGARLELFFDRVRKTAYTPMYAAQSILAEWIGDTRIAERAPLITTERIEAIEDRLKPGDILLERRNWYLSNAFLPGFWPHAALYVGRVEDLRNLKLVDDPAIQVPLRKYLEKAPDGREHTVIESVSEGVIFNSLTESMHADYAAVLRPRLSEDQIARAIAQAFRHHGKPYDFEFDFFTSDKLVCTELVYRAYEGMLHFDLVKVMGRDTLPALELVRKYAREKGRSNQELDFVLFLDGEPASGQVRDGTEGDFVSSAERPSTFSR